MEFDLIRGSHPPRRTRKVELRRKVRNFMTNSLIDEMLPLFKQIKKRMLPVFMLTWTPRIKNKTKNLNLANSRFSLTYSRKLIWLRIVYAPQFHSKLT
jgi:hypothetical protein